MALEPPEWRGPAASIRLFSGDEAEALRAQVGRLAGWRPAQVITPAGRTTADPGDRRAEVIRLGPEDADAAVRSGLAPWLKRMTEATLALDAARLGLGASSLQDVQLVRYRPGGFYGWHCDTNDRGFRKVSALCYVNDDVEGGETSFAPAALQPLLRRPRVRQLVQGTALARAIPDGCRLRPEAGRLIVFDAFAAHQARPVRRGVKYVFALFLV